MGLKLVFISDTHGLHRDCKVPDGDILIHCGDITNNGEMEQIADFNDWSGHLPHIEKICIAGNHCWCFEDHRRHRAIRLLTNWDYLEDSGVWYPEFPVQFWGSPVTPTFFDWAFNRDRGPSIKKHWDKINLDTEVLITHGPPYGILDETPKGEHAGCVDLLNQIEKLPKLKVVAFGHIHSANGIIVKNGITFINAAICNEEYDPVQEAKVVEIP